MWEVKTDLVLEDNGKVIVNSLNTIVDFLLSTVISITSTSMQDQTLSPTTVGNAQARAQGPSKLSATRDVIPTETGSMLWDRYLHNIGPSLTAAQELILESWLQNRLPELQAVENEVRGRNGLDTSGLESSDPLTHPLAVRETVDRPEEKKLLDELHEARLFLNGQRDWAVQILAPVVVQGKTETSQLKPERTWVIIVGMEITNGIRDNLPGALEDARHFEHSVQTILGVSADHIITLISPIRSAILDALRFPFGDRRHGASYPLPSTSQSSINSGQAWGVASIEAICPHDRGVPVDDQVNDRVQDISDRELNCIFSNLADEFGPNITVIMDCCHAGGMGRLAEPLGGGRLGGRSVPMSIPRRVPPMDRGLKEMLAAAQEDTRNDWTRTGHPDSSDWVPNTSAFVLIASSQDFEVSRETTKGGYFTSRLLQILSNTSVTSLSYRQLLESIGKVADIQHPTLVGDKMDDMFLAIGWGAN
ncbi:hypothetical protein K435DRAFT_801715 [Dendrothele bispora CBS 962.96]|uniref:Peptidase C14 caspase domain-containing protein n=1 Tax=Dendrothele bispora (strain CBS 962.96) TaxID=1314807 RepID=A0A4S8LNC4_DENBC|nr:hypothetical protein K435DRAFT_801715 [Dendrothele bispora CBS 962.96]